MQDQVKKLEELIHTLRSENGCPWDRKQTPQSMGAYLIEEVYELMEAIESGEVNDIEEELGDVLFQLLFISCLYQEKDSFNIESAAEKTISKMIRRHPHVFGEETNLTTEEVRQQWRKIKKREKQGTAGQSILDSIPKKLPALMRAYRISERAGGWGFDWDDIDGVVEKVEEEWSEFKAEIQKQKDEKNSMKKEMTLELGDIFFTMVNVGRFLKVHPETALSDSTKKFENRFRRMEEKLADIGETPDSVERNVLDQLWDDIKKESG